MDSLPGFVTLINSVLRTFKFKHNKIIPTEIVYKACKAWTILIVLLKQCTFLVRQKSLVHVFVFFQLVISVCGQPLDLPPEGFPCGTVYCTRWGFDTCITSSSKPYCLPCNHDQLPRHCGTKDEYPGCSLYCADLVTKDLKTKLDDVMAMLQRSESNLSSMAQKLNTTAQNLTITTSELHKAVENLTETTQKLQRSTLNVTITAQLLHQAEHNLTDKSQRLQQTLLNLTEMEQMVSQTEKDLYSCRKEKDDRQQFYTTLLIVIPVACGVLLVSITLIVVCKMKRKQIRKQDVEISDNDGSIEETSLMTASRSDSSSIDSETCRGTKSCYGKQKLTNVQPTDIPGNSALACNQTNSQHITVLGPNPNHNSQ